MKVALLILSLFANPNGEVLTNVKQIPMESMSVCMEHAKAVNLTAKRLERTVFASCEVVQDS